MGEQNTQFLKWFGPLLDALRDLGDSGRPREVSGQIAKNLGLGDDVLDQSLKSGGNRFHNQVAWARQYLVWEGHLDSSKHGTWTLTDKGRIAKLEYKDAADIFKKWTAYHAKLRKQKSKGEDAVDVDDIEAEEVNEDIELISVLRGLSPQGFENVEVTGGSADDGIDGYGTLELNPFVSFKVMFQCKRYKEGNSVSRPQVGDFRNAMIGRAEKGIIITTSSFTSSAIKEASRDGAPPIELIDGVKLVEMFEKVELGLRPRTVFDVDITYFEKYRD